MLAISITGFHTTAKTGSNSIEKMMKTLDIWALVDYLPTKLPFDRDKIYAITGEVLREAESNQFAQFFKGGPVLLKDGVEIESIDLRVNKEQSTRRLLILRLAGNCVPRDKVFGRNHKLELSDPPRGRSLGEEANWSMKQPWGTLSFGFAERNPDCLRSVLFSTE